MSTVREWFAGATWHGYKVVDILRNLPRDKAELLDYPVIEPSGVVLAVDREELEKGAEAVLDLLDFDHGPAERDRHYEQARRIALAVLAAMHIAVADEVYEVVDGRDPKRGWWVGVKHGPNDGVFAVTADDGDKLYIVRGGE